MAFTSGTATSWSDLLDALHAFVTGDPLTPGRDWTEQLALQTSVRSGAPYREVVYKNIGISGTETILVGISENVTMPGWYLNSYVTWITDQDWWDNGGCSNEYPVLALIASNLPYWFVSNAQRIMGVVKCGSVYQSFYLGFANRLADPDSYPFPYYVAGSCGSTYDVPYDDITNFTQFCISPRISWSGAETGYSPECACQVVSPANIYFSAMAEYDRLRMLPFPYHYKPSTWSAWSNKIGRDTNGRWMIYPVYASSMSHGVLFALDGMAWIPGKNLQAEDELNVGGDRWLLFPNCFRTSTGNFMAMKTEETVTWTTTSSSTTTTTTTAA